MHKMPRRRLTPEQCRQRAEKADLTVMQKGWDAYEWWTRQPLGTREPANPYYAMSAARQSWPRGYRIAKIGMPRPGEPNRYLAEFELRNLQVGDVLQAKNGFRWRVRHIHERGIEVSGVDPKDSINTLFGSIVAPGIVAVVRAGHVIWKRPGPDGGKVDA